MNRNNPSLTDENRLREIDSIAEDLGLNRDDYEPYGRYKAKLAHGLAQTLNDRPQAKYIGVTAINPTPLGEGKTVMTIGLAMALCQLGHTAIGTIREPSLAPVFGIKGGGAGRRKMSPGATNRDQPAFYRRHARGDVRDKSSGQHHR